MPTEMTLEKLVYELAMRLRQFGFKPVSSTTKVHDREKYRTVVRLRVAGARANVYAFQGPYLRGRPTFWVGFGSRSVEAINLLQEGAERGITFCDGRYDEWDDYVMSPALSRKLARCGYFAREDYREDAKWIWLGRYLRPDGTAATKAASFVVPCARPLLYSDDADHDAPIGNSPTEKTTQAKRRLVQTAFRQALERRSDGCCVVTKCSTPEALRASHILAWKDRPELRADPDNGLLLVGTLDALFDRGRISFGADRRIMISEVIPKSEWRRLGLNEELRIEAKLTPRQREFLEAHRKYKFLKF